MVISPMVAPSGVIYYATGAHLVARDTAGGLVWQRQLPTYSYVTPALLLSPDGQTLFFEDIALDAATGAAVFAGTPDPSDGFMVSADGRVFLRDNADWRSWSRAPDGSYRLSLALRLDTREMFLMDLLPIDGAGLPDGRVWTAYMPMPRIGSHPSLIWHDGQFEGEVLSRNWWTEIPYAGPTLKFIGLDRNGTLYWCSRNLNEQNRAECQAVSAASGRVIWSLPLDGEDPVVGGALVEGRLYLATAGGRLYAVTERGASN
jgi:outer membrane protein assembly factor BamB